MVTFNVRRFFKSKALLVAALTLFALAFHGRFATHFDHIERRDILAEMSLVRRDHHQQHLVPPCDYGSIVRDQTLYRVPGKDEPPQALNESLVIDSGQYEPKRCAANFSVAILVPYRNRTAQLERFIPYMHNFLSKQDIHYRIFVLEQADTGPWNKGILYNAGAKVARELDFPCLILHDVDLLPLNPANLYACTKQPRHMSSNIDKFRYNLPYFDLVGGVLAILTDQYVTINGFSNRFEYWGGEDDDFYNRIISGNFTLKRFPPDISRYTMMIHQQEPINKNRFLQIEWNIGNYQRDGLSTVSYKRMTLTNHKLYTNVSIEIA